MSDSEDVMHAVSSTIRGAVDKAADLIDVGHLPTLNEAGREIASHVHAGAPTLKAMGAEMLSQGKQLSAKGTSSVDVRGLKKSAARRAHGLAQTIDDQAAALSPPKTFKARMKAPLLLVALAIGAGLVIRRVMKRSPASSTGSDNATHAEFRSGAVEDSPDESVETTLREVSEEAPRQNGAAARSNGTSTKKPAPRTKKS